MSLLPIRRMERSFPDLRDFFTDWMEDDFFVGSKLPAVDVQELDSAYIVKADLPGFSKDNIEVDLNNGVLSIKAQNESSEEIKHEGYLRRERRTGSFCRSFAFPGDIDPEQIQADFKDGVLTVELTKSKRVKGRRIDIN